MPLPAEPRATLLRIAQLRAGLSALVGQQLVLMGAFVVISVYLWVVLGLDAFQTGKHLLPLSVAMLVFALLGQRIAARRSLRTVAQLERRAGANGRRDERCPRESGRAPRRARLPRGRRCRAGLRKPAAISPRPRLRSAVVPLTAIVVHVTRPGGRADELLAAVAKQLGRGPPIPDERGHVRILLEESEGAAWQRVHDALDAAGDDWHEHLHVNPRPG